MFVAHDTSMPFAAAARSSDGAPTSDDVGALLRQVLSVFPDLKFTSARVEDRGGDHRLLILDDACAFRFPRAGMHGLELEIAVLAALQRHSLLPTPIYSLIDPSGAFAGYHFIPGVELTPDRFAAIPIINRQRLLGQAADFLRALHSLSPAKVWPDVWRRAWLAADYAQRASEGRIADITRGFPALSSALVEFFDSYRRDDVPHSVVLHGDLVSDHILIADGADRLAGIIDFGDVALGDPAQDLMGFWAYGPAAVGYLIRVYAGGPDPELFRRSHGAFVRHRIDSFWDALNERGPEAVADEAPRLAAFLSRYADPGSCGNQAR